MLRSRWAMIRKYGKDFWNSFKRKSDSEFETISPLVPEIGESIFAFNYEFAAPYIAWYKALLGNGLSQQEASETIWLMNEKMVKTIPTFMLRLTGKRYMNGFRKEAAAHIERQQQNKLHPYDWKVAYREIDDNTFEVDITECALKKLAHHFNADGLLPGICRLDYLFSNLMEYGFERTKTLGDGDECCNNRFFFEGSCEWAPEKGFITRK